MKTSRNEKEIEQIRQKIIEGALDIIVKDGFDAFTMRKLASRIGMTAPNIYNYFSGKDALYLWIVIKGYEMLHQDLEAAYHSTENMIERIRSMIRAYISFGMNRPRYYDIMFTRPTPKYNDYIGTPHEKLSEIEYQISMKIADLALKVTTDMLGKGADTKTTHLRVIHIWSLLHGMITLHNSSVVSYVAEETEAVYSKIIDEYIDMLAFFASQQKA